MNATETKPPTASELLADIRRLNPNGRYARYANDSAIGEWIPSSGRFAPVYEKFIDGRWCCNVSNDMILETLSNGVSSYKPELWVE